jgi:Fe-S cluster biogenesis protein NfuA
MADGAQALRPGETAHGPPGAYGLSDEAVQERISRLDSLLERLEQAAGPTAETAVQALQALTEVYGTALARVVALASGAPRVMSSLLDDELLHHLLILHDIHPQPVEARVARALEGVRPYIRSHGGEVELVGISEGVAHVRLSGSCQSCGSSATTLEHAVRESVLAVAPELTGIEAAPAPGGAPRSPALIPVDSLLRKPSTLADADKGRR